MYLTLELIVLIIKQLIRNPQSTMEMDLKNVDPDQEAHVHKLKRLVQRPDSYFMDVRCKVDGEIITVFSHSQNVVYDSVGNVVAVPTGGKVKLVVGNSWRRKGD